MSRYEEGLFSVDVDNRTLYDTLDEARLEYQSRSVVSVPLRPLGNSHKSRFTKKDTAYSWISYPVLVYGAEAEVEAKTHCMAASEYLQRFTNEAVRIAEAGTSVDCDPMIQIASDGCIRKANEFHMANSMMKDAMVQEALKPGIIGMRFLLKLKQLVEKVRESIRPENIEKDRWEEHAPTGSHLLVLSKGMWCQENQFDFALIENRWHGWPSVVSAFEMLAVSDGAVITRASSHRVMMSGGLVLDSAKKTWSSHT